MEKLISDSKRAYNMVNTNYIAYSDSIVNSISIVKSIIDQYESKQKISEKQTTLLEKFNDAVLNNEFNERLRKLINDEKEDTSKDLEEFKI